MDPREPADPDDLACGVCREPVGHDRARLLASREDLAVVEVSCSSCASITLGFVFGAQPPRLSQPERDVAPPVTAEDVLDMHLHLERWSGDLRSLLDVGADSPGPTP